MRASSDEHRYEIEVGGKRLYCPTLIKTWHETGLQFSGLHPRKRHDLIVLHWTASENAPQAVHANMMAKRYSVHFVVDAFGIGWQMCDTHALAAHAEGVNDRAVGIEIVNRGNAGPEVPSKGVERPMVEEMIHGKLVRYADFTLEQSLAVVGLVATLCTAYSIPMRVPLDRHGQVLSTVMAEGVLKTYRGVIPHYATKSTKTDCGPRLMRLVHAHGGYQT